MLAGFYSVIATVDMRFTAILAPPRGRSLKLPRRLRHLRRHKRAATASRAWLLFARAGFVGDSWMAILDAALMYHGRQLMAEVSEDSASALRRRQHDYHREANCSPCYSLI